MSPERRNTRKRLFSGLDSRLGRLARRNAELECSNQDLQRFVHFASHDLQEPIRTIITHTEMIVKKCGALFDEDSASCMRTIHESAIHISELLADLLSFAEIGDRPRSPAGIVDLNAVLETVMQNLKGAIDESKAVVTNDALPTLQGHASDFIQLFQNLLSNAMRYRSGRALRIHNSVGRQDDQLRFAVSDNGIGIDPLDQRMIFEPFKRLHGRRIPGTGLGLAICERIILRYSGRIWVESVAGGGATFVFTLPSVMIDPLDHLMERGDADFL